MRYSLLSFLFAASFLLVACSPKSKLDKEIARLESEIEDTSEVNSAERLLEAYQEYVMEFPDEKVLNSRYLYRAAGLAYRMEQTALSLELVKKAIRLDPQGENAQNNVRLMETIYKERLQNSVLSGILSNTIEEKYGAQTPKNYSTPLSNIDSLRNQIFDEQSFTINYGIANNFILASEAFILTVPEYEKSTEMLMKGAEIARSIQAYDRALEFLDWVIKGYPDSEKTSQAMFLKAFTLDEGLKQYPEAKAAYEAFIERFPNDPFADDAKFSLNNLGKDVNELIDQFQQQEGQ